MGRKHGFRVYVVQAFANRKAGVVPEDASTGSRLRDDLLTMLEKLAAEETQFLKQRMPAGEQATDRPRISVTLEDPTSPRDDVILLKASSGETGAHRIATRPNKRAKKIKKWSAETEYYAAIIFPSRGDEFFLISQTVSGQDVRKQLIRLLTQEGVRQKKAAEEEQKDARNKLKALGRELPKLRRFHRYLFEAKQAADNSYLDEIISSASTATAVLAVLYCRREAPTGWSNNGPSAFSC